MNIKAFFFSIIHKLLYTIYSTLVYIEMKANQSHKF